LCPSTLYYTIIIAIIMRNVNFKGIGDDGVCVLLQRCLADERRARVNSDKNVTDAGLFTHLEMLPG